MAEPKKYQNKYSIYRLESFKSKVFISRTVKETGAVSKFFYYTYIDKNGNSTTKRIDKTIGKKIIKDALVDDNISSALMVLEKGRFNKGINKAINFEDKSAKIIDLGCGNGGFVYWLQQIGYQNTGGVDVSKEQIEVGQKLGIKNIHQADIKEFLITQLPNNYDIIFMRDVIEHFSKEEILDILEIIYKSLKNNGILIIQTPNAESPFSGRFRYGDFTHEISFTGSSIRQVLLVSGFKNVLVYPMPSVVHGLKSLIRSILWKVIALKLRFYLLVETGSSKGIFTQNIIAVARK